MADGIMDKSPLSLPFDIDIDIDFTLMHPSELKMEMESAIEEAVETAEDIIVRMQMMEPERMVGQYCQSINETASESAKTVKNGVLNIFSKILTNVLNEEADASLESQESTSYSGQNPFMIDLVLRNIMQYLSLADLYSCRLVCKLWNIEAGAYVRKKHRIVFSPNCIEKMANFTAFMKAQLEDEEDVEEEDEDCNENFDRILPYHHHYHNGYPSTRFLPHPSSYHHFHHRHPPSHHLHFYHKDSNINRQVNLDSPRPLPPYTDFSFTAQFPQINFSRAIVRDFSHVYGQYVKKLEIFYPNDSSLSAKDFRQFFLQGMPNVQYIHFVNLPTKLTQSSFLRRSSNNSLTTSSDNIRHRLSIRQEEEDHQNRNDNNTGRTRDFDVGCNTCGNKAFNGSNNDSHNSRCCSNNGNSNRNNNTVKDNNPIPIPTQSLNMKDKNGSSSPHFQLDDQLSHYQDQFHRFHYAGDGNDQISKEEVKTQSTNNKLVPPHHQDCLLKWNSLTHLKIDRTLLIEVAWSKPFLEDLFFTMPNLKHYELWTWNTTGGDGHSNPYFACLTEFQRQHLVSLYPGSVGESLITGLADYGLNRLKKLHLPVFSGEVSAQSVELLLMNLKGTLEELQVNCSSMQDSRMIHFPRMEKLVVLHMIISVPWKNVYTLFTPSIEYQNQFPVLETLKLELAVYHDFGFIHYFFPASGNSIGKSLKELDISFSGYRDEKFIGIVAKIFPNLRKLRLDGYGNRILASICLYLHNLEYFEMYLIYGFNVDDQLTGIDRKICNEIRKCERYLDFKMDEAQVLPSLANLNKLKILKIKQKDYQAKFWPQAQCVTDITGYFALAKIKTLRHLHIESVKFSPECRQYLATTLEDCWLDFL